ncbi:hypothetical protein JNK13_00010 [bacterium]|nr:hypothetical protein [bacterium]
MKLLNLHQLLYLRVICLAFFLLMITKTPAQAQDNSVTVEECEDALRLGEAANPDLRLKQLNCEWTDKRTQRYQGPGRLVVAWETPEIVVPADIYGSPITYNGQLGQMFDALRGHPNGQYFFTNFLLQPNSGHCRYDRQQDPDHWTNLVDWRCPESEYHVISRDQRGTPTSYRVIIRQVTVFSTARPGCARKLALRYTIEECAADAIAKNDTGIDYPAECLMPGSDSNRCANLLLHKAKSRACELNETSDGRITCRIYRNMCSRGGGRPKSCSNEMQALINNAQILENRVKAQFDSCLTRKSTADPRLRADLARYNYTTIAHDVVKNRQLMPWDYAGVFHRLLKKHTRFTKCNSGTIKKAWGISNYCGGPARVVIANYGRARMGAGHVWGFHCNCNPGARFDPNKVDCKVFQGSLDNYNMTEKNRKLSWILKQKKKHNGVCLIPRGEFKSPFDGDACFQ